MDIILLSEHADPLIGGATHLSSKIASSIAKLGHNVTFVVPNSGSDQDQVDIVNDNFKVIKVRAYVPIDDRSKFKGKNRRLFSKEVDSFLKKYCEANHVDVIQILSGTYLIRYLDVAFYQKQNILLIAGVLNVPPQECGLSWKGDSLFSRIKDEVRQFLIQRINKQRLTFNKFDGYTVESEYVKRLLSNYIGERQIKYIPLGTDEILPRLNLKGKNEVFNILTAGGISPSKNQHVIPIVASELLKRGFKFHWYIIGPVRNLRYNQFLINQINKFEVQQSVILINGMKKDELMKYYAFSDLYVQTSTEEGFCMTALDALVYGLPLIGLDTGAIAEFIVKGRGILVKNSSKDIIDAIIEVINHQDQFKYTKDDIFPIIEYYNWQRIAGEYIAYYKLLKDRKDNATKI